MAGLFPNYILRETNNDGKMLSGGRIYFYESGTYTPKTVYSDYTLSMPLTNPVVLDASGSADIWLGDGAYRVLITTSTGTQVRAPIDGITGTGGGAFGAGSNASVSVYKIYQDLRNDTNAPDVAYCCGATAIGDGGGGWFNRITTAEPDDNGICLVQGSTSYKRVFSGYISPEWYGVAYGVGVDQTYPINAAFAGSVRWNVPVRLTGSVYVTQNINIPSQASLYTMAGGYFVGPGPTAVQITLSSGAHIDGDSAVVFGDNIQPIFQAGVCDAIRLSWFGGDDDYVVWAKLDVASTAPYQVLVDRTTTLNASNLAIASNFSFRFVAGCMVNFTGSSACNVDIVLDHDAPTQIMSFASVACVGTINLHSTKCYMEWFGGSHVNTGTSNAIPFSACIKAKQLDLLPGNLNYTVTSTDPLSYSEFVTCNGNGSKITLNQDITVLGLYTNDITIYGTGSITHSSLVATKTSSIVQMLQGPTSLIDSNVTYVTWLVHAQNSQVGDLAKITGTITDTAIARSGTVELVGELNMSGGSVTGESVAPAFSVLDDSIVKSSFTGVRIDVGGTLLYTDNVDLVVDCIDCDGKGWSVGQREIRAEFPSVMADACKAIHNGICTVNVVGTNIRGNSTATSVNGISQRLWSVNPSFRSKGIRVDTPIETPTSTTTNWHGLGVGSMTTDGTSIITGMDLALASTPWSTNTLRYAGLNADGSGTMSKTLDLMWRVGGQIYVTVQYPNTATPDPGTKLCVAFVSPNLPVGGSMIMGLSTHQVFGVTTPVNLITLAGAKLANYANVWGGQTTLSLPPILGAITVVDEWGDLSIAVGTGGSIPGIPRLVLYNAGSGTIPTGTKITIEIGAYAPTKSQYDSYWPDTPFGTVPGTAFQSNGGGGVGGPGLYKTPYVYRTADDNGIQVAKARPNYGTGVLTPTPIDLPVTVWTNGTTLNGSYS